MSPQESMLRALMFDFDGVVADTEPIHFAMFQKILAEIGLPLTEADYYDKYVGYDDKGCFAAVLAAHGRAVSPPVIEDLVARKARVYLDQIKQHLVIFPGVRELVHRAAAHYRLAIVSGALRHEIEFILEEAGIRKEFGHITSAEDVRRGKPDPEGYLHALAALNRTAPPGQAPLAAGECLVIEDAVAGIRAAQAAGMKVLAVANTQAMEELIEADARTLTLEQVHLDALAGRLFPREPIS